ncbi:MAG TPA: DNA methylase [Candidatus Eubacterium avistercoris]|uniref:DNA methylase n=1 Tax=Candidatus Eubacterium avistercoris TaxID=2838567 RepID=A0A9D2IFI9_9FIRM|nr:DNA methylase [Candidatus Eubacterium avistercoris]
MEKKQEKSYIAIDLKSFYASVECAKRGLDPLDTNLVVADSSRTQKTICLAVSPSLKALGIPGRPRLFEVEQKVKEINAGRREKISGRDFKDSSCFQGALKKDPFLKLDFITAVPRMALYLDYSTRIYKIYLKYLAPEDIHVYSIDEVFMDVTGYLNTYQMSAKELAGVIIRDVYDATGITAAAGIGTNLYLCKIAMDIMAKHAPRNADGVRIASLDEMSYRRQLWDHRPITDFWRVGKGYAAKLAANGMYTMGDIARCSLGGSGDLYNENLLYRLFGVNAELLIDHAWGWEPCTMEAIKNYRPQNSSICSGQVLHCPYTADKARLVVKEMTDLMGLELTGKGLVTDQIILTVGYDRQNLTDPDRRNRYRGEIKSDRYGRKVPVHAHGTANLKQGTASCRLLIRAALDLYDRIIDRDLLVRRITITVGRLKSEADLRFTAIYTQMDLFTDWKHWEKEQAKETEELEKEKHLQQAVLNIKKRFGKNALLKGMSLEEGATAMERNRQIGGHKA